MDNDTQPALQVVHIAGFAFFVAVIALLLCYGEYWRRKFLGATDTKI